MNFTTLMNKNYEELVFNLIFPRKLHRHWLCCTLVRYRSGLSHTLLALYSQFGAQLLVPLNGSDRQRVDIILNDGCSDEVMLAIYFVFRIVSD